MPAIVCKDDLHGCGAKAVGCVDNFKVSGKGVHRGTDSDTHGATQNECSAHFKVNGHGVARIGDKHGGCPNVSPPHEPSPHVTGNSHFVVTG